MRSSSIAHKRCFTWKGNKQWFSQIEEWCVNEWKIYFRNANLICFQINIDFWHQIEISTARVDLLPTLVHVKSEQAGNVKWTFNFIIFIVYIIFGYSRWLDNFIFPFSVIEKCHLLRVQKEIIFYISGQSRSERLRDEIETHKNLCNFVCLLSFQFLMSPSNSLSDFSVVGNIEFKQNY